MFRRSWLQPRQKGWRLALSARGEFPASFVFELLPGDAQRPPAGLRGVPNAGGEFFYSAEAEVFVEADGGRIDAGHGEGDGFVVAAAQRLDGTFHQRAADAVSLMPGHHADLGGVADAFGDGGRENHAHRTIARRGTHQEAGFGQELPAAGQQHDVAEEFHSSGFGAVLVVDVAVDVIGVGQLDQPRRGFEGAIVPGLETQAAGNLLGVETRFVERQQHELAVVQFEILRQENRIELSAEGHQLGFDPRQARGSVQRGDHFGDEFFSDGFLRELRGDVQAADQAFVIFQDVETVPGGAAVFHGGIAAQRARVDEFLDELDRGAIVPVKFVAPVADFFLEQWLERARLDLAKIEDLRQEPGLPAIIIDVPGSITNPYKLP